VVLIRARKSRAAVAPWVPYFMQAAPCLFELVVRSHMRRITAFKAIQASIALLVLLSIVHPSRAVAADPDLETVLTGSRQRIERLDYRLTGRLTRVEGNEKRTSYKFAAKAHWFPDGLRILCEITGPGSEKTRLLLQMSMSGHLSIEKILPGEKAASVLPFEHWKDPIAGTDFSYEDMVESQFFWKSQKLLAPEKYGARDCFVLKSMPGAQDRSYYDSVTSWIDRSILYPVHVVKTLHGTGQGIYLLRAAAGQRRLVCVADRGKARRPARFLDSCNRGGLSQGKSWTQGL
jgi:hypothetical protein